MSDLSSLKRVSLVATAGSFLLGSAVYFIDTALSVSNLLSAALLPLMLASLASRRYSLSGILLFCGFLVLTLLALFMALGNPEPQNVRFLRAVLVAASAIFWAHWLLESYPEVVAPAVGMAFFIALLVAVAQLSFVVTGVGLDPLARLDDYSYSAIAPLANGFPSVFSNPNDFSVFSCLVFLFFALRQGAGSFTIALLAFLAVLISGSKVALVICILGFILLAAIRSGRSWIFLLLAMAGIAAAGAELMDDGSQLYAVYRLLAAGEEILQGSVDAGSSIGLRMSTYEYFFSQYPSFLVGSFDASAPFPQFRNAEFDASLMAVNPHSMIIELHSLFGVAGLLVSLLLLGSIVLALKRRLDGITLWFVLLSIVALTNVSSSTFHSVAFFALSTLIAAAPGKPESERGWGHVRQRLQ